MHSNNNLFSPICQSISLYFSQFIIIIDGIFFISWFYLEIIFRLSNKIGVISLSGCSICLLKIVYLVVKRDSEKVETTDLNVELFSV